MDQKTNTIKWLALITMTIDHIGYYLYPELSLLRLIGRLAFPCYLYTTVQGVKRTSNFPKYISRLLVTAIISYFLLGPIRFYWNILFSLTLFALSLKNWRLFLPALLLSQFTEYGTYGFVLGWAIKVMVDGNRWLGLALVLGLQVMVAYPSIQFYALFAVIPMLMSLDWPLPRFPKWVGYVYYPLHQLALFAISFIL